MTTEEDSYDTTRIVIAKTTRDSAFESGDVKERVHMCEICGIRFGLLENLNRHRMIHTDQRPFPCTYCTKRFRLAQHLKEHIRIHTGEKPYKCPTCGRAFCQISNLKSHQKTHTKIKAFKCDICDKCFRRAFTLKQHKLTHSKRSLHGSVRAASDKDVQRSVYHALSGKQSDDTACRISSESAIHRHHFLNHAIPNMTSDGRFIARSPPREFQVPATPSEISQTPVPPNSAPARIPQVFVQSAGAVGLDEEVHPQTPSEISQCPSLSALLRTDCDARMNTVSSMKNVAPSLSSNYYKPTGKSLSTIEDAEKSECNGRSQDQQERLEEVGKDYYRTSDFSCVQCNRRFSNQMELRNHAIEEHSRKNGRRDSAYSSHSDKSPTQSPSLAAVPFRQASDVPPLILSKSHFTEDSFMKRVKELALISLGRYSDRRQEQHTNRSILAEKKRVVNNQRSDLVKRERAISLEVGHSPTPTETIKETKADEATRRDSDHRDDEIKIIRRGFCGSKKWKRELCKEWYEVPQRSNIRANSLDVDCEMDGPQRKHLKKDICNLSENKAPAGDIKDKTNDPIESAPKSDSKETSPSVSNFHRFAPIVEWKPVVTGWKDMVCGTLYALPPHAQHSYLQSMYDPRLVYSNSSSTESSESHLATEEVPDNGTSPRYFRFSPHALANFPIEADSASCSAGDSALHGVYSHAYPTESMPSYSRLQHALLHNWDPNRQRLGGTSSVPQTPNLISAT